MAWLVPLAHVQGREYIAGLVEEWDNGETGEKGRLMVSQYLRQISHSSRCAWLHLYVLLLLLILKLEEWLSLSIINTFSHFFPLKINNCSNCLVSLIVVSMILYSIADTTYVAEALHWVNRAVSPTAMPPEGCSLRKKVKNLCNYNFFRRKKQDMTIVFYYW